MQSFIAKPSQDQSQHLCNINKEKSKLKDGKILRITETKVKDQAGAMKLTVFVIAHSLISAHFLWRN